MITREVDGALHIETRGSSLALGLLFTLGAVALEGVALTAHSVPWVVHALAAVLALAGLVNLLALVAVYRVILDPRTRCVVVGKVSTPWKSYTGVMRVCTLRLGVKGAENRKIALYLVGAEAPARLLLAVTHDDEASLELQRRVARVLELPMLADELGGTRGALSRE